MPNVRISRRLAATISEVLVGSHAILDALFISAGAPTPPPELPHNTKWKTWIFQAGTDPDVDSLEFLGNLIEEFMDFAPNEFDDEYDTWQYNRQRVVDALEADGFRYYQGGRVLPNSGSPLSDPVASEQDLAGNVFPRELEDLLSVLVRGLPRAMHPLTHRRKGATCLAFTSEYDIQDLLHSMLRPWIADIRPEEYTPSYAGSSTRMDFLMPKYSLVIEIKFVRDRAHGRKIGDELIIDIEHYRRHPQCSKLWCVVYDPAKLLQNAEGLRSDLEGERRTSDGDVQVRLHIV